MQSVTDMVAVGRRFESHLLHSSVSSEIIKTGIDQELKRLTFKKKKQTKLDKPSQVHSEIKIDY